MAKIRIANLHDRKGVAIGTDNDWFELDLKQAKTFNRELLRAIEHAEKTTPLAPAPLDVSEDHPGMHAFAEVCHFTGNDFYVVIATHEIGFENTVKLRDWLNQALDYREKVIAK